MGSGSGPIGWGSAACAEQLRHDPASLERPRAGLQRMLPSMARAGLAKSWGWPIDVSADRVPFFSTYKPGIHYAVGFSGHGVQAGWIAGQCLTSLVLEQKNKWYHSPFCQRRVPRLPPEPFKYLGVLRHPRGDPCLRGSRAARAACFVHRKNRCCTPGITGPAHWCALTLVHQPRRKPHDPALPTQRKTPQPCIAA
ncbi:MULTISPECIES: FAD-dependent oxidoreductase [unclassified Pseudomonas]|uniref:FAD-dependent oxidoreductase n=1 Tax=unclassified Pseudomonas TaxID=196821 RepID=UPI003FA28032